MEIGRVALEGDSEQNPIFKVAQTSELIAYLEVIQSVIVLEPFKR